MKKITILGAGSWGSALANLLSLNNHQVTLWDEYPDVLESIRANKSHKNLPGLIINPDIIILEANLEKAVSNSEYLITVIPAQFYESFLINIKPFLTFDKKVINCSKGIDVKTTKLISELFFDINKEFPISNFTVLSGPSYATEVANSQPTAVVVAGSNELVTKEIQNLFSNSWFRVYTNLDVIGVELAGAVKNVIAIAAGICFGIGYGVNASAALITRGNAEIVKLGIAIGGQVKTFHGLAGFGDLLLTATSEKSRNFSFGKLIGEGISLDEAKKSIGMVIEGIETVKSTRQLAHKYNIEMPIVESVFRVIFEGLSPENEVKKLMLRSLKAEC